MNREYRMTEAQHTKIMEACKPIPYIIVGGYEPPSPQENANRAWQALGEEMGFLWDSVRPVDGKSDYYFTAVPKP